MADVVHGLEHRLGREDALEPVVAENHRLGPGYGVQRAVGELALGEDAEGDGELDVQVAEAWPPTEALRAIAFLVRDRNWGTYNPAIADLAVDQGPDGFKGYLARAAQAGVDAVTLAAVAGPFGSTPGRTTDSLGSTKRTPRSTPTTTSSPGTPRSRALPSTRYRSALPARFRPSPSRGRRIPPLAHQPDGLAANRASRGDPGNPGPPHDRRGQLRARMPRR